MTSRKTGNKSSAQKSQGDPLLLCLQIVNDMLSKKMKKIAWAFHEPVDPKLNPEYYQQIQSPIDLKRIKEKLQNEEYSSATEFQQDVELMFQNCREFNHPDEVVSKDAVKLETYFVKRMSEIGKATQNLQEKHGDTVHTHPPITTASRIPARRRGQENSELSQGGSQEVSQVLKAGDFDSKTDGLPSQDSTCQGDTVHTHPPITMASSVPARRRGQQNSQLSQGGSQEDSQVLKAGDFHSKTDGLPSQDSTYQHGKKVPKVQASKKNQKKLASRSEDRKKDNASEISAHLTSKQLCLANLSSPGPQSHDSDDDSHLDGEVSPANSGINPAFLRKTKRTVLNKSEQKLAPYGDNMSHNTGNPETAMTATGDEQEVYDDVMGQTGEQDDVMPYGDMLHNTGYPETAMTATGYEQEVYNDVMGQTGEEDDQDVAAAIDAKIKSHGDNYRKLKMDKAPKSEIEAEMNIILTAKAEFKTATGLDWKFGIIVPKMATNPPPCSGGGDYDMSWKVAAQVDKVRQLKANKAPKDELDAAVKILLGLKAEYKTATGKDWAPAGGNAQTPNEKGEKKQEHKEKDGFLSDKDERSSAFSPMEDEIQVYVENLPDNCTKEDLRILFSTYGKVTDIIIFQQMGIEGKMVGSCAAITYNNKEAVEKVLKAKKIMLFGRHRLIIQEAKINGVRADKIVGQEVSHVYDPLTGGPDVIGIQDIIGNPSQSNTKSMRKPRLKPRSSRSGQNEDYEPYPYKEVADVFDPAQQQVVISKDSAIDIETRIKDAFGLVKFEMKKCCDGEELAFYEYMHDTMASDPTIMHSGINAAIAFQMNGAKTVIHEENGHISPVNIWRMGVGEKGINKSAAFDIALKPLIELEEERIERKRKDYEKEVEAKLAEEPRPKKRKMNHDSRNSTEDTPTKEKEGRKSQETTPQKKNLDQEAEENNSVESPSKEEGSSFSPGKRSNKSEIHIPVFNEQKYRNIMQGGTPQGLMAAMMNAERKSFMMNFDEVSSLISLLFSSSEGSAAHRTTFCDALLPLFSSREARTMKAGTGSQVLSGASLQIYAVGQPLVVLDLFLKNMKDPAGVIDRITFSACNPVDLTLRQMKTNINTLKKVDVDVKELLITAESLNNSGGNEWTLSEEAREIVYQIDEKMCEMIAEDTTGKVRAMNAKGRDKIYRESAVNACKRISFAILDAQKKLGTDAAVKKEKIIEAEDVLKAAYIVQYSNFVFMNMSAAAEELERFKKNGRKNPQSETVKETGFVSQLETGWKRELLDYPTHFEKVYAVYGADRDEEETNKICFKTLLSVKTYVRASSAKKFTEKECLLYFLRFLSHNGLGKVYFGNTVDKEDEVSYSKKVYNKIKFQPLDDDDEDDLSEDVKKRLNVLNMWNRNFMPVAIDM